MVKIAETVGGLLKSEIPVRKVYQPKITKIRLCSDTINGITFTGRFNAPKKWSQKMLDNTIERMIDFSEKMIDKILAKSSPLVNVKENAETLINKFKEAEKRKYNSLLEICASRIKYSSTELPEGEYSEFIYGQHSTTIKSVESIRKNGFNPFLTTGGAWDLGRGSYFSPKNEISSKENIINVQFNNGKIGYISRKDYGYLSSQIAKSAEKYAKSENLSEKDKAILHNELFTHIIHHELGFDGLYLSLESNILTWTIGNKNRSNLAHKIPQLVIYNPKIIEIK